MVEPSAAVPLAAILEGALDVKGKRAALVLSGENVELDALPWMKGPETAGDSGRE